jgi:hypothetical protein
MKRTVAIITGAVVFACVGMAKADDFQCFKAKGTFVKTSATVTDTYAGTTNTQFKKPFLLCDDAKIGTGAPPNPASRLRCFKVKGAKLGAAATSTVSDFFGARAETYQKVFVVCSQATATP